jgi:hypothetical protein
VLDVGSAFESTSPLGSARATAYLED